MSNASFAVGINWQYWQKKIDSIYEDPHSVYHVSPRYTQFKSEILQYTHISNVIREYTKTISKKATEFHKTKIVKSIRYTPKRSTHLDNISHYEGYDNPYGICEGDVIPIRYLQCIILWTDYTDLATEFSSTFRPSHKYETLAMTKQRHSRYYWLSKGLKEMIYFYGQQNSIEDNTINGLLGIAGPGNVGLLDTLQGPLFTGMKHIMPMTQFQITLYGPTSTSIHKEVASRFADEDGMIIEFQNTTDHGRRVKGFDVSWISRYGMAEDERCDNAFVS